MKKKRSSGFPTMCDTNRSVQSQKQARGLNFGLYVEEKCTIRVAKIKALINYCTVFS